MSLTWFVLLAFLRYVVAPLCGVAAAVCVAVWLARALDYRAEQGGRRAR